MHMHIVYLTHFSPHQRIFSLHFINAKYKTVVKKKENNFFLRVFCVYKSVLIVLKYFTGFFFVYSSIFDDTALSHADIVNRKGLFFIANSFYFYVLKLYIKNEIRTDLFKTVLTVKMHNSMNSRGMALF